MKKVIFLVFSIFILLILAFKTPLKTIKKGDCQLITNSKKNVAGSRVTIEFKTHSTIDIPQLFIKHSYGKTLVEGKYEKGKLIYRLPDFYSKKSGELSWFLFYEGDKKMEGNIEIVPNKNTETQIENYLGPRSILAGGSEFTMLVCVPTDAFDNPVIQNTTALIKSQFLDQIVISPKKTKDFIAWKNIYSSNQSGKILVSTEANAISSKEIETEVYANIATDFTISYKRNHVFADGNQVTVTGKGRHDPCVVPRAVPIVEAMAALVLVDFYLRNKTTKY